MATVYLARDLRHDRQVALKVLRPELGAVIGVDRFLAEIRVTANLQHPHLLPLFDSGEESGLLFYVMPYVPGESLRARLDREQQLSVDDAVRIAIAVASALDYAHRNNVVHRDLKPENILLQDGEPVVSDFGIALAVSNAGGPRVTQTGLSLGTPAYMSPEQASGDRTIDARSDVYSLGAVLYEMLIGEPPHTGANSQQIISRILTEIPRGVSNQRATVNAALDEVVRRALAKLPADRYGTARDMVIALRAAASEGATTRASPVHRAAAASATSRRSLTKWFPWGIAAASLVAAWMAASAPRARDQTSPPVKFAVVPPGGLRSPFAELSLSADGTRLLIADGSPGGRRLWLRDLVSEVVTELPVPAGAQAFFLSPTGSALGYIADERLRSVDIGGGATTNLTTLTSPRVFDIPSWGSGGVIILTRGDSAGIWAVDAVGGALRRVSTPDASQRDGAPSFLSDGEHFFFERRSGRGEAAIMLGSLDGKEADLGLTGSLPRHISGFLAFLAADGTVSAVQLNAAMKPTGATLPVVSIGASRGPRRSSYVTSATGILAYVESTPQPNQIVTAEQNGTVSPYVATPRNYASPAWSPDGRSVAVEVSENDGSSDIWVFDTEGGSRRLTRGGRNTSPLWSPSGSAVVFGVQGEDGNPSQIVMQSISGADTARTLYAGRGFLRPAGFATHRDTIRVYATGGQTSSAVLSIHMTDLGVVQWPAPAGERSGVLSPDNRWLAYSATEGGRSEVFVRPAASAAPLVRVSDGGGEQPRWSRDGRSLYYRDSTSFVHLGISPTADFRVLSRRSVFADTYERGPSSYDVDAAGRFLLLRSGAQTNHVDVLANVGELLNVRSLAAKRAAAGR